MRQGLRQNAYYWKNGFAVIRSSEFPELFIQLQVATRDPIKGLYATKAAGKVGVCAKTDCVITAPGVI